VVVELSVHVKFNQAKCSGLLIIVLREK